MTFFQKVWKSRGWCNMAGPRGRINYLGCCGLSLVFVLLLCWWGVVCVVVLACVFDFDWRCRFTGINRKH